MKITPRTAAKVKDVLARFADRPAAPRSLPSTGEQSVWVRCDSSTAAGVSGVDAHCYPATLLLYDGDTLGPTYLGQVWLTPVDTTVVPAVGPSYRGQLIGPHTIAGAPLTITIATETGTTVTITTSAPHGFQVGQTVTVAGITPAGYSGAVVITGVTSTTFTYTAAADLGAATLSSPTATPAVQRQRVISDVVTYTDYAVNGIIHGNADQYIGGTSNLKQVHYLGLSGATGAAQLGDTCKAYLTALPVSVPYGDDWNGAHVYTGPRIGAPNHTNLIAKGLTFTGATEGVGYCRWEAVMNGGPAGIESGALLRINSSQGNAYALAVGFGVMGAEALALGGFGASNVFCPGTLGVKGGIYTLADIGLGPNYYNGLTLTVLGLSFGNGLLIGGTPSVTGADIATGTITSGNIQDGTITGTDIATGTITSANIQDGAIVAADIAAGTITTLQIAAGTILGSNIAAGTIADVNILDMAASKLTGVLDAGTW